MGPIPSGRAMRALSRLPFNPTYMTDNDQVRHKHSLLIDKWYTSFLKKQSVISHYTKAHKHNLNPINVPELQHTLSMVTQFLTAQMKPALFTPTLQSKKSVSRAPQNSTSLLTPLSPPTQLLAATLSPHHCQCHCHHHAQHVPTLLLTFPLTKPGPWGFSC